MSSLGGKPCIEAAHSSQRISLRFPFAPHPRNVVADFIVACVVAHRSSVLDSRIPLSTARITRLHPVPSNPLSCHFLKFEFFFHIPSYERQAFFIIIGSD